MEVLSEKLILLLPTKKIDIFGFDSLMKNTIPYYILPILLTLAISSSSPQGYLFIFVLYSVLPILDQIFSFDLRNPTEPERKQLQKRDFYFRLPLYLTMLLDWILFFRGMNYLSTLEFTLPNVFNLIGFIFIFSNLNAVQFAVAHQIFHKNNTFDRYIGTIHMIKNLYIHFTYEHIYGHHRRVATPQDPASAEKGLTLYEFIPRSYFGSYRSVYQQQKAVNKKFYMNYSVLSVVASVLFASLILKCYGLQGFVLFLIQAFGSIVYLEAINYLEHYGLRREKKADGNFEKVTIRHSWNAPHRISNYLLFKLQRHSDHHENSLKPYQTLVSMEESPHLPHGYNVIILLSFFPKQWFEIMDPLVDQYKKTKKGCIDGEVMKKAVFLVKKFIMKGAIISSTLFMLSVALK